MGRCAFKSDPPQNEVLQERNDNEVVMRRVAKCRVAGRDGYWKSGRGTGRVPMIPTRVFASGYPSGSKVAELPDLRGIFLPTFSKIWAIFMNFENWCQN